MDESLGHRLAEIEGNGTEGKVFPAAWANTVVSEDLSETNKDKRDHRTIAMYRKIDEPFQPSDEQLEYWIEPFLYSGLYLIKKENGEFTLCHADCGLYLMSSVIIDDPTRCVSEV